MRQKHVTIIKRELKVVVEGDAICSFPEIFLSRRILARNFFHSKQSDFIYYVTWLGCDEVDANKLKFFPRAHTGVTGENMVKVEIRMLHMYARI